MCVLPIMSEFWCLNRLTLLVSNILYFLKNEIPTAVQILMGRRSWLPSRNLLAWGCSFPEGPLPCRVGWKLACTTAVTAGRRCPAESQRMGLVSTRPPCRVWNNFVFNSTACSNRRPCCSFRKSDKPPPCQRGSGKELGTFNDLCI